MMLIDRTLTMDAEQSTASATATTSTTGVPTLAKTTVSPSAKSTVDSILLELGRKGLRKAAANLPHHSTIRIEPQTDHSDAEHLFRLCIGTLSSGEEVWIYVGSKPKDRSNASNLAPTIKVYASHNGVETRAVHSSAWHEIRMIEPFKELWKRTSDSARKENKSWMDQRRGMFKSLVFWYFANEGAARGERLRFPEFMRSHYLVLALRKLGEVAPALRSENLSGMGSDGVDGIAAMLGGLSQHERQQKDIEARIREEGKKKKELAADTKALEDLEKEKEAAMRQRRIDTLRSELQVLEGEEWIRQLFTAVSESTTVEKDTTHYHSLSVDTGLFENIAGISDKKSKRKRPENENGIHVNKRAGSLNSAQLGRLDLSQ